MEYIFTAREKMQNNADYLSISEHGLETKTCVIEGDGKPKSPLLVKISITNKKSTAWLGVIHVELAFPKKNPRYFLPAFVYGRNRGEAPLNVPNEFPRLREEMNRPASPWWMVRSDRLSHPTVLVFDTDKIYGFCASPYFICQNGRKVQWKPEIEGKFYQYAGYSCSLEKGSVGYTLGYENAPWLFVKSHDVRERAKLEENCFVLEANETVNFTMQLFEFEASSELDINQVIQEVYDQYHQSPRKGSSIQTTVEDLANAVSNDAWISEDLSYSGQVFEEQEGYRYNKIYSISWTNGLSVATPMLMASLRLNNAQMREQALSCINNILDNCLNQATGLPYEFYHNGEWSNKGWWFDGMHTPGHSSYLIGQAMYYALKAYDYEKQFAGCIHKEWMEFAVDVLKRVEKTKNTDGEYPFILSEKTGAGIEYDALSGAWCMAAMAFYSYLAKDNTYLDGLIMSEQHYYETFIVTMECYGGPLDTDKATDSEGVLAYIKGVRYLHAITKDDKYLRHMYDAICYAITFQFCYQSPVKTVPLSRIGWSSSGGSVTSIANPHIHPMSSNMVDELQYYVRHTNDEYIKKRIKDMVGWGCQTYNTYDKEYDYGKKGWMSERFCHCEGLLSQKYSDGSLASTWFCLMPWASASIIEGLVGDYWEENK